LQRRIKFNEIEIMKKAFYQFEKLFKKEKVLAAPHKQ
jgi:hypothetical protein